MAKKSFKGGLDNLLASAGIKKKADITEKTEDKMPLSDDEKDWFIIKIERIQEELKLWRTGKLSVEEFNLSLKKHGLEYKADTNEISEL